MLKPFIRTFLPLNLCGDRWSVEGRGPPGLAIIARHLLMSHSTLHCTLLSTGTYLYTILYCKAQQPTAGEASHHTTVFALHLFSSWRSLITAAKKAWNPFANFSNISHEHKLDLTKQKKSWPEGLLKMLWQPNKEWDLFVVKRTNLNR